MSVVGRCGNRDRTGAPDIGVAQLEGQLLELIGIKAVVIPQDMVVTGPGCSLDTLVGTEIEVEFCGVSDANVHRGTGRNIA